MHAGNEDIESRGFRRSQLFGDPNLPAFSQHLPKTYLHTDGEGAVSIYKKYSASYMKCACCPIKFVLAPPFLRSSSSDGLTTWIEEHLDCGSVSGQKFMGGSSWSSAYVYETTSGKRFFVKTALGRSAEEMFAGEALGLQALHGKTTSR